MKQQSLQKDSIIASDGGPNLVKEIDLIAEAFPDPNNLKTIIAKRRPILQQLRYTEPDTERSIRETDFGCGKSIMGMSGGIINVKASEQTGNDSIDSQRTPTSLSVRKDGSTNASKKSKILTFTHIAVRSPHTSEGNRRRGRTNQANINRDPF